MRRILQLTCAAVLGVVLWAGMSPTASAQVYYRGGRPVVVLGPTIVNPNYQIAPNLSVAQAAYNARVLGNAYRAVPPYALGYNPYPQVANYGYYGNNFPSYNYGYVNPYNSYYFNPYAAYSNPYAVVSPAAYGFVP